MNVLAVGAHPDDYEFGVFGTLANHTKKGDKVTVLLLTRGERGGDSVERIGEAYNAGKTIGCDIIYPTEMKFQDGYIRDNLKLVQSIEDIIKQREINTVYTQTQNDRHQDHRYAAYATTSAARRVDNVFAYESPSATSFTPQRFQDVTDFMETKLKAIRLHKSQAARIYLDQGAIKGLAQMRGFQAGWLGKMAEAFEVVRMVG